VRVVTTTCSNTEIVCALGCADRLVGVDDHSDHPEEVVRSLPRVGPDLGVDPARVAALQPDLVIASLTVPGHERVVEALERAGLPVLALEPTSLGDVMADIRRIAEALGVPARGRALADEMREALRPVPVEGPRPSVLVEWWPKPVIVPGRESWVTALLDLAGGRNPLGDEPVKSRPLAPAQWESSAADAIVLSWCGVPAQKYRPDVVRRRANSSAVPAVRDDRIFCIPEAFLGRPGPRLVEGFSRLRRVVEACRPY